eukprot:GHRQ01019372.1.p2 GENE.GHRQ01019372.1~~GHRQ01019372.1.p2  ORF type:complete len:116 (+),score=30.72 GHRQ01019372.1:1170-1517(+)
MVSVSSLLQLLHLQPLWGGGFLVALCQLSLFYYVLGAVLHWVVPLLGPVQGIQEAPRKPGEVARDAVNSIGEQQAHSATVQSCLVLLMWMLVCTTAAVPVRPLCCVFLATSRQLL